MSNALGALLDTSDVLPSAYTLEVSSPGLDRVLKKEKDLVRFKGRRARITIATPINGQRNFLGEIVDVSEGKVTIDDVTGKQVTLYIDGIVKARLEPEL
jgi:ribosome maturation factor RimP